MVNTDDETLWHNDGHIITLQLNKSNLEIIEIFCPNVTQGESATCSHDDTSCVVKFFLETFGLDCNVGVVAPSEKIQMAWAFVGDRHKDLGTCQVWVIPSQDEAFSAWIATQN